MPLETQHTLPLSLTPSLLLGQHFKLHLASTRYSESLHWKTEQIFDHLWRYAADVLPGEKTLEQYDQHFQAPLKRASDFGQKLITRRYKY